MRHSFLPAALALTLCLSTVHTAPAAESDDASREATFLSNTRQLTFGGKRAGEGYFSADGKQLIFGGDDRQLQIGRDVIEGNGIPAECMSVEDRAELGKGERWKDPSEQGNLCNVPHNNRNQNNFGHPEACFPEVLLAGTPFFFIHLRWSNSGQAVPVSKFLLNRIRP